MLVLDAERCITESQVIWAHVVHAAQMMGTSPPAPLMRMRTKRMRGRPKGMSRGPNNARMPIWALSPFGLSLHTGACLYQLPAQKYCLETGQHRLPMSRLISESLKV